MYVGLPFRKLVKFNNFTILFLVDEEMQLQSSCEIIRQHLDIGGVRNIRTFKWQQVSKHETPIY